MTDLNKLSDEELQRIAGSGKAPSKNSSLAQKSDAELMKIAGMVEPNRVEQPPQMNKTFIQEAKEAGHAGLMAAGQSAMLGFGDEVAAGISAANDIISHGKSIKDIGSLYDIYKNANRKELGRLKKESPIASTVGTVAGYLAPGAALTKVAKAGVGAIGGIKGISDSVAAASLLGGIDAAGNTTANPLSEPGQFALDSSIGTIAGGITQKFGNVAEDYLKMGAQKAEDVLRSFGQERSIKAATGESIRALKKIAKSDGGPKAMEKLRSAGATLLEHDSALPPELDIPTVQLFNKVEDIATKANAKAEFYKGKIREVSSQIDQFAPNAVNGQKIAQKIMNYAADEIADNPANHAQIQALMNEANYFEKLGGMSFAKAQDLKNSYIFKPMDQGASQSLGQKVTSKLNRIVSDEMEEAADHVVQQPGLDDAAKQTIEAYKDFKHKFDVNHNVAVAASSRDMRNLSNRFLSLTDMMAATATAGGMIAGSGNVDPSDFATGLFIGMANKLARTRGNATSAVIANGIANTIKKNGPTMRPFLDFLAREGTKGGPALLAAHAALLKNEPDYAKAFNGSNDIQGFSMQSASQEVPANGNNIQGFTLDRTTPIERRLMNNRSK